MEDQMKVLVIGKLPELLEPAQTLLIQAGCRVLVVKDGRTALNLAGADLPDILLSTVGPAFEDGVQFARFVKRHPGLARIPLLLVAANSIQFRQIIEALDAGADECLQPPYTAELLVAKVSRMIARKREEEGLVRSREMYLDETQLLSRTGSFECHIASGQWICSKEFFRIAGLESDTPEVSDAEISRHLKIDGNDLLRDVVEWSAREFEPLIREVSVEGPERSLRTLEMRGRLAGYERGTPPRVIGTLTDITEKRQGEDALRECRNQMLQSQKMEAFGKLAGGVAHDFNNLLTVIMGYNELISQSLDSTSPLFPHVEQVKNAGERATRLIRQLLAFSRQQMVEPRVVNLNSIIENLTRMLSRIIGENIELRSNLEPELGDVRIDPGQAEQVILNLAVNSRDAMPEGGKLIIETHNVVLDEKYVSSHLEVSPGEYVVMAVSDTGCGMDEETRTRAFEPFFTTKESGKGTGLGLSTVFWIVKQAGGSIWVYSEPGKGTTFKIYLPRTSQSPEDLFKRSEDEQYYAGNETILLVEDEEILRGFVREVLTGIGYRVLVADKGQEAIRIGKQHTDRIHLLLTDVLMPEMDGHALSRQLLEIWPEMRVLYMSGHTPDTTAHITGMTGSCHFIQKPFSPFELAKKVRDVLDQAQ